MSGYAGEFRWRCGHLRTIDNTTHSGTSSPSGRCKECYNEYQREYYRNKTKKKK